MFNPTTITRYTLPEPVDMAQVPALLREARFLDIEDAMQEQAFGWTNIDDMLDTEWKTSPPEKGNYITFALRIDTRAINPAVYKKHVQIAMDDELAKAKERGKDFISKGRKAEIREQVKLRLLPKVEPVPKACPVVWDIATNEVVFFSNNGKAKRLFEDYFDATFGARLVPASWTSNEIEPPEIGTDFLRWLWDAADDKDASFVIGERSTLRKPVPEGKISAQDKGDLEEIQKLVQAGWELASLEIIHSDDTGDYTFTVHAESPALTGIKTPKVDKEDKDDDPDALFLEKMYLIQEVTRAVDGLFQKFQEKSGAKNREAA